VPPSPSMDAQSLHPAAETGHIWPLTASGVS
jgi:hypothetical protein